MLLDSRHSKPGGGANAVGFGLQISVGLVSLYIMFFQGHYVLGAMLLIPAVFIDVFMRSVRRDMVATGIKVMLLFQGIILVLMMTSKDNSLLTASVILSKSQDSVFSNTRNNIGSHLPANEGQDVGEGERELEANFHEIHKIHQQQHHMQMRRMQEHILASNEKTAGSQTQTHHNKYKHSADSLAGNEGGSTIPTESAKIISTVFGQLLPPSDHPDLVYHSAEDVRKELKLVFEQMQNKFDQNFKNPCWFTEEMDESPEDGEGGNKHKTIACLPYAYVLGQPKCGTSDLFERLKRHPDIRVPRRKEVRWFTRGEFTTLPIAQEVPVHHIGDGTTTGRGEKRLGPGSSIYSFTSSFENLARDLMHATGEPSSHHTWQSLITIDGGPHTWWWPTQNADGSATHDIPAVQLLREMQPDAKFLITLSDPVKRLYSDYYFLNDNLRPVRPGDQTTKSSQEFHQRCATQILEFKNCITDKLKEMLPDSHDITRDFAAAEGSGYWFRASQICAHDRHKFAVGGWGRISIGIYALYHEKWLEHFLPEQFLVLRLEDYDIDPQDYMKKIFDFLDLPEPDTNHWNQIITNHIANEHRTHRDPILKETEDMLRAFHKPYNELLAKFLAIQNGRSKGDVATAEGFKWELKPGEKTLREIHVLQELKESSGSGSGGLEGSGGMEDRFGKSNSMGSAPGRMGHAGAETAKEKAIRARRRDMIEANHNSNTNAHDIFRHMHVSDPFKLGLDLDRSMGNGEGLREGGGREGNLRRRPEKRNEGEEEDGEEDNVSEEDEEKFRSKLKSKSLDLSGLPRASNPNEFNKWLRDGKIIDRTKPIRDEQSATKQLCAASFALDLAALEYLLYEVGIPANGVIHSDAGRNAFHCLAFLYLMGDGHARSQIYAYLKGQPSWLNEYIDPPLPTLLHSVMSRDIVGGLDTAITKVAQWLERAGVDPDLPDHAGNTPLHIASTGGLLGLMKVLLKLGADPNARNNERRTPLHFAVTEGHAEAASLLIEAKADVYAPDRFDVQPFDLMYNPGPISKSDALKFLNVTQRPVRKIERLLHPELSPTEKGGWKHGTGGWDTKRLAGWENKMHCDMDQYFAHEITGDEIFRKYIARSTPVLIRGLIDDWPAAGLYALNKLNETFGDLRVSVSDIPYASKYGGAGQVDMTLGEYISEVRSHDIVGGKHPWYVFKGHPIPYMSDAPESLVSYEDTPTPNSLIKAFEAFNPATARGKVGKQSRELFINAQWALGGGGTGAPVHFHNTAWNALIYGAKEWVIYPPQYMIMSNKQILDYVETDKISFEKRGVHSLSCIQTAGDVLIVPESWGHGVLNIQDAVAVATESKTSLWRLKPATALLSQLPNDNRVRHPPP